MPTPSKGESEKDFVSRCIPIVLHDGTAADSSQAAAICYSMFRQHKRETGPCIELIDRLGAVNIFRVDGKMIRGSNPDAEQFTNWACHEMFPDLIPQDEIWLDQEAAGNESPIYVAAALEMHKAMSGGMSYDDALKLADQKGRSVRAKLEGVPVGGKGLLPEAEGAIISDVGNGAEVHLCDGDMVRRERYEDFTEGGHDLVYDFIPQGHIWIDDDVLPDEQPYVIVHESAERSLMAQGKTYPEAHAEASHVEYEARRDNERAMDYEFTRCLFLCNLENDPVEDPPLQEESRKTLAVLQTRLPTELVFVSTPQEIEQALARYDPHDTLVFNWVEGLPGWFAAGETVTNIIEEAGFAHTASSAAAQRIVFDRGQTYLFLKQLGIPAPNFQMVYSPPDVALWKDWPAIIRPNEAHGSEDMQVVESAQAAQEYITGMMGKHQLPAVLIEYVSPAREFSVGLLSDGKTIDALPIAEADFSALGHDIKDEEDKSPVNDAADINKTPAPIDDVLQQKLTDYAKRIMQRLGGKIYFRTDWRLYENQTDPICIDVNTEPDICSDSLMAEMAKAAGMTWEQLILGVLDRDMAYYQQRGESVVQEAKRMNAVQELWENIKRLFEPLLVERQDDGDLTDEDRAAITRWLAYEDAGGVIAEADHEYHTAKMKNCVADLEAKGADAGKAHRICYAALGPEANRSYSDVPDIERAFDDSAWSGTKSNYSTTAAFCKACLINLNTGKESEWVQALCKLPVKAPGKSSVNRKAMHSAAAALGGARGGLTKPSGADAAKWSAAIKKAANKLISLYKQDGDQAPDSVYKKAGKSAPQRAVSFLPTTDGAISIARTADGQIRWLAVAASAVVNRVGAIDSTILFDNFVKRAKETGDYPVLDYWHECDELRFGQADWIAREGALYLASGTFDDTPVARACADGLEKRPDYWGTSIMYRVLGEPLVLKSEGEIPVYEDGINTYISIVPKRAAADLFTSALVARAREVKAMTQQEYEELVKLVGEERAKPFLAMVAETNRTITGAGLIVRADQPTEPPAPVPAPTPEEQRISGVTAGAPVPSMDMTGVPNDGIEEVKKKKKKHYSELLTNAIEEERKKKKPDMDTNDSEPPLSADELKKIHDQAVAEAVDGGDGSADGTGDGATSAQQVELSPEALDAITNAIMQSDAMVALVNRITALEGQASTQAQSVEHAVKFEQEAVKRLAQLEKADDVKKREWQADLPEDRKLIVTYRPREAHAVKSEGDGKRPQPQRGKALY